MWELRPIGSLRPARALCCGLPGVGIKHDVPVVTPPSRGRENVAISLPGAPSAGTTLARSWAAVNRPDRSALPRCAVGRTRRGAGPVPKTGGREVLLHG